MTPSDVEGLFAADLAFLQDLYGIINFGDPADVEALQAAVLPPEPASRRRRPAPEAIESFVDDDRAGDAVRAGTDRSGRRAHVEEVPSAGER